VMTPRGGSLLNRPPQSASRYRSRSPFARRDGPFEGIDGLPLEQRRRASGGGGVGREGVARARAWANSAEVVGRDKTKADVFRGLKSRPTTPPAANAGVDGQRSASSSALGRTPNVAATWTVPSFRSFPLGR